jgi:hypothetical protein
MQIAICVAREVLVTVREKSVRPFYNESMKVRDRDKRPRPPASLELRGTGRVGRGGTGRGGGAISAGSQGARVNVSGRVLTRLDRLGRRCACRG